MYKINKSVSLSLALMLCMSIFASLPLALAAPTIIKIDPARVDGPPPGYGVPFDVNVLVSDVANLWAFKVAVEWNPAVLDFVAAEEGAFLKQGSATIFVARSPDQVLGKVTEIACTRLATSGVTGSGVLVKLTFKADGYSLTDSPITLYITELRDNTPDHASIVHTVQNAVFTLPPPPSGPPTAAFTPANGAFYYVSDPIALDASASLPGMDQGVTRPITGYAWRIDVGNDGSYEFTFGGVTAGFTAPATAAPVKIELTVTTASGNTGYINTDSEVHILSVVTRPSGPSIDLYTNRGGEFYHQSADAYGPQELVVLTSIVKYNDVPVVGKDVAFQIQDNQGNTIGYRTARTDANGIATTNYRIPWPASNPEALFGEWKITSTVDISQVVVEDYVKFKFGYVIEITSVQIVDQFGNPDSGVARGQTAYVKVNYKSIATIRTISALITATIYDEARVPVSAAYVTTSVSPLEVDASTVGCIIPAYAFVGTATAYGDAYSLFPVDLGVPFCAEKSAQFSITVS